MNNDKSCERQAHATRDLSSRRLKALKIERLLGIQPGVASLKLLEIGCGSGGIAHYFATHQKLRCVVTAVDKHDNRSVHEGYTYVPVQGVQLPFEDASFDVLISNHVIEHVGDGLAQLRHLEEMCRVLKPGGIGYLAVPNRWMLTEPHYQLKFLSWLPHTWRTPYLQWSGKGTFYDCEPMQMRELETMLNQADLDYCNLCIQGLRATLEIERPDHWSSRLLARIPDTLLLPLKPIIPTLIYRLERRSK